MDSFGSFEPGSSCDLGCVDKVIDVDLSPHGKKLVPGVVLISLRR